MAHICLSSLPSLTISILSIEEADMRIYGVLQLLKAEVVEHLRQSMIQDKQFALGKQCNGDEKRFEQEVL